MILRLHRSQREGLCGQPMMGHRSSETQQACHMLPIPGKVLKGNHGLLNLTGCR